MTIVCHVSSLMPKHASIHVCFPALSFLLFADTHLAQLANA